MNDDCMFPIALGNLCEASYFRAPNRAIYNNLMHANRFPFGGLAKGGNIRYYTDALWRGGIML